MVQIFLHRKLRLLGQLLTEFCKSWTSSSETCIGRDGGVNIDVKPYSFDDTDPGAVGQPSELANKRRIKLWAKTPILKPSPSSPCSGRPSVRGGEDT